jgi:hypothetical protein
VKITTGDTGRLLKQNQSDISLKNDFDRENLDVNLFATVS